MTAGGDEGDAGPRGEGAPGAAPLARGRLESHEAELARVDGERAAVICAAPFPPGRPATLVLGGEPPLSLALKVVGSKRLADGRFEVRARIVMLRREDRERLAALRAGAERY